MKNDNGLAKVKYPSREEAEKLLKEAESCNPGPWGNHSRTAAHCAEAIAARSGMNPEKAYVLGLLMISAESLEKGIWVMCRMGIPI